MVLLVHGQNLKVGCVFLAVSNGWFFGNLVEVFVECCDTGNGEDPVFEVRIAFWVDACSKLGGGTLLDDGGIALRLGHSWWRGAIGVGIRFDEALGDEAT